jgi:hypothetical protein
MARWLCGQYIARRMGKGGRHVMFGSLVGRKARWGWRGSILGFVVFLVVTKASFSDGIYRPCRMW